MDYFGEMDYSSQMDGIFAAMGAYYIVGMIFGIIMIVALWKIFQKAGQPGWAAIVPIYNIIVYLKVVNRPTWWILLMLIPGVNIVVAIITSLDLGKSFGKSTGWSIVMLLLLSFIGQLILGFGKDQYTKIQR